MTMVFLVTNGKYMEGSSVCQVKVLLPHLSAETEESHKNSIRKASLWSEIWTKSPDKEIVADVLKLLRGEL
jgi:hypothetical protein